MNKNNDLGEKTLEETRTILDKKSQSWAQLSPADQQGLQNDSQLYKQAKAGYESGKLISRDAASKAYFPEVREKLVDVSIVQKVQKKLEQEDARLTDQIAALSRMTSIVSQRSKNMESMPESLAAATSEITKQGGRGLASSGRPIALAGDGKLSLSSKSSDKKLDSEASKGDSVTKAEKEKMAAPDLGLGKSSDKKSNKLREELARKLAESKKAADADKANRDTFGGKLTDDLAAQAGLVGGALGEAGADALATKAMKDVLGYANENADHSGASGGGFGASGAQGGNERFSLAGAETDAAVRQLTADAEGVLHGSSDPSIQGMESQSLFERVHSVHKSCVKQGCVQVK